MAETNGTTPAEIPAAWSSGPTPLDAPEPTTIPIPDEITSLIGEQQLQIAFMRRDLAASEQRIGALTAELQRVNALASEAGVDLAPVKAPEAASAP